MSENILANCLEQQNYIGGSLAAPHQALRMSPEQAEKAKQECQGAEFEYRRRRVALAIIGIAETLVMKANWTLDFPATLALAEDMYRTGAEYVDKFKI